MVTPWVLHPDRPGGLALWREPGAQPWDDRDLVFANSVAGLVRVILERGPGEATIDRLTGLPNRAYFLSEVNRYINRLEQDGRPGSMMLVDINGLRQVNATHGRGVGDDLLVRTARLLRALVRPVDVVARVGGDEFAIWMDTMDNLPATERAVNISERRLTLPAPVGLSGPVNDEDGILTEMTFAVGLVSRVPGDGEDARTLLRRAHTALWQAKQTAGGAWAVSREAIAG
jgi:diguanylate cyclase (GGDEF)-like protein